MKKYIYLQIIISAIIILLLAFLLNNIFFLYRINEPAIDKLEITADSTFISSPNMFKEQTQKLISELNEQIEVTYNNSIDRLKTSITLFSLSLGIFALLIGFFSFNKVKEIKKIVEKVESSPERIIHKYYEKQIASLSTNVFKTNNILRSETIKQISTNPILSDEHYELILSALEKEVEYKNNPDFFSNIQSLISIMVKLSPERAFDDLLSFFMKNKNKYFRLMSVINHLVAFTDSTHKNKIMSIIKDEKRELSQFFINALLNTDSIDEDYMRFILEELTDDEIISFLHLNNTYQNIKISPKYENYLLNREKISGRFLNMISHTPSFNSFSSNFKASLVIKYLKNKSDLKEVEYEFYEFIKGSDDDKNFRSTLLELIPEDNNAFELFQMFPQTMEIRLTNTVSEFQKKYMS